MSSGVGIDFAKVKAMANTNELKNLIEPYVRKRLTDKYGNLFEEKEMPLKLKTGGLHKFDVISKDRTIVGGIKANSLRKDGKVGAGVIKSIFTELYFLSLVEAKRKVLILTNKGFYELFKRRSSGQILPDTDLIYCKLSKELESRVAGIHKISSGEIGKRVSVPK